MTIKTNDCFTALNGVSLYPGMVLDLADLDAGSEENDEKFSSIPGPGCASISCDNVISRNSISCDNVISRNGKGFVRVH